MDEEFIPLPHPANEGDLFTNCVDHDVLSGLEKIADHSLSERYQLTDIYLSIAAQYGFNKFKEEFPMVAGEILVIEACASQAFKERRFRDFWRAVKEYKLKVGKTKTVNLERYKYIAIFYGGTDIGYHWSLLLCLNPWSSKSTDRCIWHFDSLPAGHDTQELIRKAGDALNAARAEMEMDEVTYVGNRASSPIQPNTSMACGCYAVCNLLFALNDLADGKIPTNCRTAEYTIQYSVVEALLIPRDIILPALKPALDQNVRFSILGDRVTSSSLFADEEFLWPWEYSNKIYQQHEGAAASDLPREFKSRLSRARSPSPAAPAQQSKRQRKQPKQHATTAAYGTQSAAAADDMNDVDGQDDGPAGTAATDADETEDDQDFKTGDESDSDSEDDSDDQETETETPDAANAKGKQTAMPPIITGHDNSVDIDDLKSKLDQFNKVHKRKKSKKSATTAAITSQGFVDTQAKVLAALNQANQLLQQLVQQRDNNCSASSNAQSFEELLLSKRHRSEFLNKLIRALCEEDPYPSDNDVYGMLLEYMGKDWAELEQLVGAAKGVTLLQNLRTEALKYLRIDARDEFRKMVVEVAVSVLEVRAPDGTLDKTKAGAWLQDDKFMNGAACNIAQIREIIRRIHNRKNPGNKVDKLGEGDDIVFFEGSLAFLIMQVRRLLRGEFKGVAPTGGAAIAAHIGLKIQFLNCVQELRDAQTSSSFKLQQHGVELVRSRKLQVFRRRASTIAGTQRILLGL